MKRSFVKFVSRLSAAAIAMMTLAAAYPAAASGACSAASILPPIDGVVVLDYGQAKALSLDTPPVKSRGVLFSSEAGATVTAPASAYIEYVGTIENMGHVVILNIGDDRRIVLGGMASVSVASHQIVEAHGRVGVMMESDTETPYLYMELRCGDEPVKPNMSLLSAMR